MPAKKIVNWLVGASLLTNVVVLVLVATSCGGRNGDGYGEQEPEPQAPQGDDWNAIKKVVDAACGKCHDGTNQKAFDSDTRLRSSKALTRLENGTMPPGGKIDPTNKSRLIAYLKK